MKKIKLKIFFYYLSITFLLIDQIKSVSKCNQKVMRKFTLTGMKYSVYDRMRICRHIHDKCCSVADEIKIIKLWQQRTKQILMQNIDLSVMYMRRITESFDALARQDPRSLGLKYIVQRQVPYKQQFCRFDYRENNLRGAVRAVQIYRRSLRFSMRRLVDKIYGNNEKGRKLKLIYNGDNPFDLAQEEGLNKQQLKKLHIKSSKQRRQLFNSYQYRNLRSSLRYIGNLRVNYKQATCSTQRSYFYKDFIIVNSNKSKTCINKIRKQFDFDNIKFKSYIGKTKAGLTKMAYYKGNFYCSLCDAHQQKFFDLTRKKFIFSHQFCRNLLTKSEAVIKFMNIVLIEYLDFLFGIISCYDSSGDSMSYAGANFLQKYKRRIPLINRCYQSLNNGDEFMQNCWFICHSFKVLKVSDFYDGNLQMLKQAHLAAYSVVRKLQDEKEYSLNTKNRDDLGDDSNVDGMLVEPPGPQLTISDKYYMNGNARQQLLGTKQVAKKLNRIQIMKLRHLFQRYRIPGLNKFVKNYQKQFEKVKIFKNKKKKQKYMKKINKLFTDKIAEIKTHLKNYPDMDPKVLIKFKKQFKLQYKMGGNQIKSKVTPEHRPLRKLKTHNYRVLEESQNEVLKQAQILQKKLKLLKLKQQSKNDHQRKLREMTEAQIQQQQQHPGKPLKGGKLDKKKDQEEKEVVEPGSQVYEPNMSLFSVSEFKLDFEAEGIDTTKFVSFLRLDDNIDDIISKKFKKQNQINIDVINSYLALRPKVINEFNHMYKDFVMGAVEMKHTSESYTKTKQEHDEVLITGDVGKITRARLKLAKIHKDAHSQVLKKKQKQEYKEMKEKIKDMKREKIMNKKVIINNHVDEKHFEKNFHGIKDLFVKLFGT